MITHHKTNQTIITFFILALVLAWLAAAPAGNLSSTAQAQEPLPPDEFIPAEELPPEPLPTAEVASSAPDLDPEVEAAYQAIEVARLQGTEAVIALQDSLSGLALELARPEIAEAQAFLAQPLVFLIPDAPTADRTVGIGCTYATIASALSAANPGDRLLLEGNRIFYETIDINKNITIEGGYAGCASGSTAACMIDGSSGTGSVVDVTSGNVTLRNLLITGGDSIGAGVDANGGNVTLDNTDVYGNAGTYGGGVYVAPGSIVTATLDSDIYNNTASISGGGVRVWGTFVGNETLSDIYGNSAPDGGGISAPGGKVILHGADINGNHANGATGKGGGIYVFDSGIITMTNTAWIYSGNTAYDGAGIYADHATISMQNSSIQDNVAANEGGGLYLTNGSVLNSQGVTIGYPIAGTGNEALRGAGMAVITSTVTFSGDIINNLAQNQGGGIYARAGTLNLNHAYVGGVGPYQPNQLGTSGHNGPGLALVAGSTAILDNTTVAGNSFQATSYTYGGGAYLDGGSAITLTNQSTIGYHLAPDTLDGRGAGLYLNNSRVAIDHSQVISNTAGAVGGGIRLFGTSVLTATNSASISFNQATTMEGGAIAADGMPNIDLIDTMMQHNTSGGNGGAVFINAGTLDLTGWWDLRWNEAAGNGGALAVLGTADADLQVTSGAQPSYLSVNHASGNGGAIYLANSDSLSLYATQNYPLWLTTNSAAGGGGALFADAGGLFDLYGQIVATSNHANGNGGLAALVGGSGIWIDDFFTTRPQIWINDAANGGAIFANSSPRVELDGVDFGSSSGGNKATSGSGGAIYLQSSSLDASNCSFHSSQASQNGGAIAAHFSVVNIHTDYPTLLTEMSSMERQASELSPTAILATACNPLTSQCSSFSNNLADSNSDLTGNGGAIYVIGGELDLDQTYLHDNQAVRGGALFTMGAGTLVDLTNTLIYDNSSTTYYGSGIRVEDHASITVTHTTFSGNTGGAAFSPSTDPTTTRIFNSIVWGNDQGLSREPTLAACNLDQDGIAGLNQNPLFVAPAADDYHLTLNSPAVNACSSGLPTDLDGYPRPSQELWDMGVYEVQIRPLYLPAILNSP